jgi:hypothetical protein
VLKRESTRNYGANAAAEEVVVELERSMSTETLNKKKEGGIEQRQRACCRLFLGGSKSQ